MGSVCVHIFYWIILFILLDIINYPGHINSSSFVVMWCTLNTRDGNWLICSLLVKSPYQSINDKIRDYFTEDQNFMKTKKKTNCRDKQTVHVLRVGYCCFRKSRVAHDKPLETQSSKHFCIFVHKSWSKKHCVLTLPCFFFLMSHSFIFLWTNTSHYFSTTMTQKTV